MDRWNRFSIMGGLIGLCAFSWVYLVWMARAMSGDQASLIATLSSGWTPGYFGMTFAMWVVMMAAMMIPSVIPMVLTFAVINRKRFTSGTTLVPTWIFVVGYLFSWTIFSLLATFLQWGLHSASLLSPAVLKVGPAIGAALFVLAGLYQWTPFKDSCLAKCSAPLDFLLTEWREGRRGAWIMGVRHGIFCIGCCAFLMLLLFVAGVMNLLWVAALASLVLIEKWVPYSQRVSRAFGVLFVGLGLLLATAL